MANSNASDKVSLSAEIVAAYVSHNSVTPGGLPALITLGSFGSLQPWCCWKLLHENLRLSCQQCRFGNRSLPVFWSAWTTGKNSSPCERHIGFLGMTPEQYRTKWGLPPELSDGRLRICRERDRRLRSRLGLGNCARTLPNGNREENPTRLKRRRHSRRGLASADPEGVRCLRCQRPTDHGSFGGLGGPEGPPTRITLWASSRNSHRWS